jgi:hypothetical protein
MLMDLVLIRDNDGDLIMAGRGNVDNLLNAFQAELIACLQGVAADLGIGQLLLKFDAQEVVCVLNSLTYDDSVLHLIEETKFQASSNFESFACVHASRFCHEAAHELPYLGYLCTEGEGIISSLLIMYLRT